MRMRVILVSTVLFVSGALTVTAQQDAARSQGSSGPATHCLAPFMSFPLSSPFVVVETRSGSLSVPRIGLNGPFSRIVFELRGVSDVRVDGVNVSCCTAGLQGEIDLDYELRLPSGQLLATATRHYSGGIPVPSHLKFYAINYPTLTASASTALSPSLASSFLGTGSQSVSWRLTVRQDIFHSGCSQQVETKTLGTSITAEVRVDGSPDHVRLAGATAGTLGDPVFYATGRATPGAAASLELANVVPATLAVLLVATSENPVGVLGGTLHAFPAVGSVSLVTDAAGALSLPFSWPPTTTGDSFTFQFVVYDPGAVHPGSCFILSDGLRGTTP